MLFCTSIYQVSRQAKLSLLSCIGASSDCQLQELGLQLQLGFTYLQTLDTDYPTLSKAQSQLSSLPIARSLYLRAKKLVAAKEHSYHDNHLDTLSVQRK